MTGAGRAGGARRRWPLAVALALLAGLVTFLALNARTGAFDAELWQAQRGRGERDNPRAEMVVELQREHLRVGMSRAEVRRLLGEPDQRRGHSEVYELGASPVGGDDEYFVVDYDEAGTVMQLRIIRG